MPYSRRRSRRVSRPSWKRRSYRSRRSGKSYKKHSYRRRRVSRPAYRKNYKKSYKRSQFKAGSYAPANSYKSMRKSGLKSHVSSKGGYFTVTAKELIGVVIPPLSPGDAVVFQSPTGTTVSRLKYFANNSFGGTTSSTSVINPKGVFQYQRRYSECQYVIPPVPKQPVGPTNTFVGPLLAPSCAMKLLTNALGTAVLAVEPSLFVSTHTGDANANPPTYDEYVVQPGSLYFNFTPQSGHFRELSLNAANYDMYRCDAFQLSYIPSCNTGISGTVCMSVNGNPTDLAVVDRANQMKENVATTNSVFASGNLYYRPSSSEFKYCTSPNTSSNDRSPDRWADSFSALVTTDIPIPSVPVATYTDANLPSVYGYVYATYVVSFKDKSSRPNGSTAAMFPDPLLAGTKNPAVPIV